MKSRDILLSRISPSFQIRRCYGRNSRKWRGNGSGRVISARFVPLDYRAYDRNVRTQGDFRDIVVEVG